jgi:hypothetical protein
LPIYFCMESAEVWAKVLADGLLKWISWTTFFRKKLIRWDIDFKVVILCLILFYCKKMILADFCFVLIRCSVVICSNDAGWLLLKSKAVNKLKIY